MCVPAHLMIFFFLMIRLPPRSTLFPYTTLFDLASSMAFIDGTVVNVALPALQTNLNATAVDVQWVIEDYSLLLSALLLVGGSIGDHYGRSRVFILGVVLFAFVSDESVLVATIS